MGIDPDAPPIVAELAGIIGLDDYRRLEAALSGSRVYVPRRPGRDHLITRAVGEAAAALIGEYCHGQELLFPAIGWRERSRLEKAEIRRLGERLSGDEIARRLKVSRGYVYRVLKDAADARQGRLFD